MGFNSGGGQKTYLKISDGKISVKVNEGTENAVKCTNKDGSKTWWERRYPSFTGKITGIRKRVTDWGADLCIDIDDVGEEYELQMPWSSGYSSGFFLAMPNIKFDNEVTFSPWMKVVDDKKKTSLFIHNFGEKDSVKWAWTKDAPGDLPPMVQLKVKGKDVWDDTERQEYFEKYIAEKINPKLGVTAPVAKYEVGNGPAPINSSEPTGESDLPWDTQPPEEKAPY
jgi:hypothetical protein